MTISIPEQLATEFRQLGIGDNAQPVATFSAKPMEAYTLLAALQACSRHPGLSDTQRDLVLGFAHQIGDQLVAMARAIIGPDSAIETTSAMGFDPQFDVNEKAGPTEDDSIDLDDLEEFADFPDDPLRYVQPTWVRLSDDEDLHKCAGCNRFFVERAPIVLFLGEGENMLNLEVCENCAPKVLHARGVHSGGRP
jgi:hypothetical protein